MFLGTDELVAEIIESSARSHEDGDERTSTSHVGRDARGNTVAADRVAKLVSLNEEISLSGPRRTIYDNYYFRRSSNDYPRSRSAFIVHFPLHHFISPHESSCRAPSLRSGGWKRSASVGKRRASRSWPPPLDRCPRSLALKFPLRRTVF